MKFLKIKTQIKESLKNFFYSEFSNPSFIGIFINPFYFIKKGLYDSIKKNSNFIKGDILDIGCGSKPYEKIFKKKEKYIGIDIKDSSHNHKNSKVDIYYDGRNIPFEDNSFESVVCFEVLEHIKNPEFTLTEINRVLKGNGNLLLTMPFAWFEHELPNDYQRYTENGLKNLILKKGFTINNIQKSNSAIEAIMQLISLYLISNLIPKNKIKLVFWPFVAIIVNTLTFLLAWILPNDYAYYSNIIICAKKKI